MLHTASVCDSNCRRLTAQHPGAQQHMLPHPSPAHFPAPLRRCTHKAADPPGMCAARPPSPSATADTQPQDAQVLVKFIDIIKAAMAVVTAGTWSISSRSRRLCDVTQQTNELHTWQSSFPLSSRFCKISKRTTSRQDCSTWGRLRHSRRYVC